VEHFVENPNLIIFSNCQGPFLYDNWLSKIPFFSKANYTYICNYSSTIVYDIEKIKHCDIFIYQPVKNELDKIVSYLKPSCIKICFPSIYVDIWPFYLETEKYCGGHCIDKYKNKGFTLDKLLHLYDTNEFDFELNNRFKKSMTYLQQKENDYSAIKVSEFILEYYKTHRLFTTQNHPNGIIGCWVVKQICFLLDISFEIDEFTQSHFIINGNHKNSIYMKKELGIEYIQDDRGKEEYRKLIIKLYKNPDLIKPYKF